MCFIIKNKKILFISSLILLFSTLPKSVLALSANPVDWVGRLIAGIPATAIGFLFGVLAKVTELGAFLLANLLNWIIGPGFLSWSWTNPNNNPIIAVGLNITKDFVNLGLVLILIFIAFSVALRLKQYATEKTLIRLIIIALLVNFAPIVCGLIVDAANIIMNFFLQGIEKGIANMLTNISVDSLVSDLTGLMFGDITTKMSLLTEALIAIILNVALGIMFFILVAIFLLRYVAIWLLVILSPLAFLAFILPATKKFWDLWWNQLLQWSFIGIPIAFFLYLAMASFGALQANFQGEMAMPGLDSGLVNRLDMTFPYFVVIAIIGIGFAFGLSSSAMGASSAINITQKSGKWLGGKVSQKGIRPTFQKLRAKEVAGKISRGVEKVPVARWFLPESIRKYGEMRPAVEAAQTKTKNYSSGTLAHRLLKGADIQVDAAANLKEILDRGDAQDVFSAAKGLSHWKGMTDEQILQDEKFNKIISRPLDIFQKSGMGGAVLRVDPRLAKVAAKTGLSGYADITRSDGTRLEGEGLLQAAVTKAVGEARSQHIANMEPEILEDKNVIIAALGQFDRNRWLSISNSVKNGQAKSLDTIDTIFTEFVQKNKLEKSNYNSQLKAFEKDIASKNKGLTGYFKALNDQRFINTGWRAPKYNPEYNKETPKPNTPPPPSPGRAIGLGAQDIGTTNKKARKYPDHS
jgi:hypothetical protein